MKICFLGGSKYIFHGIWHIINAKSTCIMIFVKNMAPGIRPIEYESYLLFIAL